MYSQLYERLDKNGEYIAALEARLSSVEADLDQLEQYSRRTNLRVFGIPESEKGKTPLLSIVNGTMEVIPRRHVKAPGENTRRHHSANTERPGRKGERVRGSSQRGEREANRKRSKETKRTPSRGRKT